jgi:hypothetical protein
MRQVKCRVCGKLFKTSAPKACYCSAACKVAGAAALRNKWNDEHKEYMREYYQSKIKRGA